MLRWTIAIVLALTGRSMADTLPMRVLDARSSVELDALARGKLRLWLGTHVDICRRNARLRELDGSLKIHIDVAPRRAPRVTVAAAGKMPRSVAGCVARDLRGVSFSELAPRLVWDGTLRLDPGGPIIEVNAQSVYGKLYGFEVESVVLAALEQPAECMTQFFAAEPEVSAVVIAKIDADGVHVTESTADPGGAVACVTSLLAPVTWPDEIARGAQLRIALLRPTTEVGEDVLSAEPLPAAHK